ncbi:MAG: 5-oxoprolinase subunit PxpA [Clostridiales bacterium]|nr:5-oxoprolinase subunit PxpA [Clostridiales bacterium]
MKKVDLNCDLGESFGAYTIGLDARVIPHISSANVACGYHAGDPAVMRKTVAMAARAGVAVGAHPGFPDLVGFGRRNMTVSPDEAYEYMLYQLGALSAFAKAAGVRLQHVKPHGALYNTAAKDMNLALAICEGVQAVAPDAIILGLAGSCLLRAAQQTGLRWASEVFADRAYLSDGSLVLRSRPGAVITDRDCAIRRAVRMVKEGVVTTADGVDIPILAHSICVHGDNPAAVAFVEKIHAALVAEGIRVGNLNEVIA